MRLKLVFFMSLKCFVLITFMLINTRCLALYIKRIHLNRSNIVSRFFSLDKVNAHPNDSKITFDKTKHTYYYDGKPIDSSVTKFIQEFFEKFDAEKVAQKMIEGKDWPRPGYIHSDGTPFTIDEIVNKWNKSSKIARDKGSEMHENIECAINGLPIPSPTMPEIKQVINNCFVHNDQGILRSISTV